MEPITMLLLILGITIGGVLICAGVHFVPVGGAPAAMAQATGIGTGTVMLATGSGLTGLTSAGFMLHLHGATLPQVLTSGAVGAMIMMCITMLIGNVIYIFGVGVPPASAKRKTDIITGSRQDLYVSKGTEGHGMPTMSFVSGTIGGLLGGVGGSLVFYEVYQVNQDPALSGIFAVGIFIVNAVVASYNIGGTIEGFHDPKFKRLPKALISCLIVTLIIGVFAVLIAGGA